MAPPASSSKKGTSRLTIRCRVADRHVRVLRRMARQVNQVWNYCNETSYRAITRDGRWLHHFDFVPRAAEGYQPGHCGDLGGRCPHPATDRGRGGQGVLHPAGSIPANVSALGAVPSGTRRTIPWAGCRSIGRPSATKPDGYDSPRCGSGCAGPNALTTTTWFWGPAPLWRMQTATGISV